MDKVLYKKEGDVGYITLNNPEKSNPLDLVVLKALIEAFTKSKNNADRVVIYTAKGTNFTFGADLKYAFEMITNPDMLSDVFEDVWSWQDLTSIMLEHPGIILVGYQGWIVGGGFEYTLWADFRVAAKDTKIMFPEMDMGLFFSNASTKIVPQLVGLSKAKELMLLGEKISAKEAKRVGLVNFVVDNDNLMPFLEELAKKLLKKSPISLQLARKLLNESFQNSIETQMYNEGRSMIQTVSSEECKSRIMGFFNKNNK